MYTLQHSDVRSLVTRPAESIGVVIPTYNAAKHWGRLQEQLDLQQIPSAQILVIDSSSSDGTRLLARQAGYQVVQIRKEEFNHGATRQLACSYLPSREFLVFLTQDAFLARADSIENLCGAFDDPEVGAAYGRQTPREEADPIERHGRLYNYPDKTQVRSIESRHELGFKTTFFSNSFAAYRRQALEEVGGFPTDAIVSEEVTAIAKMLIAGWKVVYQADAEVVHSHRLTLRKEFSRYFDIGVHHGRSPWLLETFGTAGNNGVRYTLSESQYLLKNAPLWLPYAALRILSRYMAYQLGSRAKSLPTWMCRAFSAHATFWDAAATSGKPVKVESQERAEERKARSVTSKSII